MRHDTVLRWSGVAVLAVTFLLGGGDRATAQDPAQLLERGKRSFEAGDYAAARTDLWAYLEATAGLTGPSRLPQADALYTLALMESDAGVAAQHYRTIVEEYPAASVADEALYRLAQLDLVEGRTEEAREKLQRLSVEYPFSRYQAEVPLWMGKAWLADREFRRATDAFIEGFTRVKRQDLPQELSAAQRDALGAEYVFQLARAFGEEGDERTSSQYYAMLSLDYPDSPQAAEARLVEGGGAGDAGPVQVADAGELPSREEPVVVESDEPESDEPESEEPARAEPEREIPPDDEPSVDVDPVPPAEVPDVVIEDARPRDEPSYVPDREAPAGEEAARDEPVEEAPDIEITEGARTPTYGDPPPVVIEEAPPREERDAPTAPSGTVWLQVGAFSSAANAADLSSRLRRDGFEPQIEIGVVDGQGYYRVRMGPYRLPEAAGRLAETRSRLEARGYPARQVSE